MKPVPESLLGRPFLRSEALVSGVTPQMLRGRRFIRVHESVYVVDTLEMTQEQRIAAARLALPNGAHLTGITRLQGLGLDFGPKLPLRFVVEGDHHLDLDGVFLHRTKQLPPTDETGVTVEAAFISYCSLCRVIDGIKVGDWLLHLGHLDLHVLVDLASTQRWRAGAYEALFIANYLSADCRSLRESETRAILEFAGLPAVRPNKTLELAGRTVIGDLVFEEWKVVVEYEGEHHQEDREQYGSDIDRYEAFRRSDHTYVQITKERLSQPRQMVRLVDAELRRAGYDGPAPNFGETYAMLFVRVSRLVGRKGPMDDAA